MPRNTKQTVATMGIDIGKNSFHVVGLDRRGAIVGRQKWTRSQIEARLANIPPCLIGMEACVGAHHLSRRLHSLGRLPGNLAGCPRHGPDPCLHVFADARREPVAPRGLTRISMFCSSRWVAKLCRSVCGDTRLSIPAMWAAAIAPIAYQNKAVIYGILFKAAAETLITIAADPKHLGARIGVTAVLHTWGSALTHHPHVHMIVPGGGLSPDGKRWVSCRPGFFLPVRALSRLFRRSVLNRLAAAHNAGRLRGAVAGRVVNGGGARLGPHRVR